MPSFIKHLANTTRSYRRFRQIYPVTPELMTQWVDNARVSASAGNKQPLRYRIVTDKEQCAQIFETLTWGSSSSRLGWTRTGTAPNRLHYHGN